MVDSRLAEKEGRRLLEFEFGDIPFYDEWIILKETMKMKA